MAEYKVIVDDSEELSPSAKKIMGTGSGTSVAGGSSGSFQLTGAGDGWTYLELTPSGTTSADAHMVFRIKDITDRTELLRSYDAQCRLTRVVMRTWEAPASSTGSNTPASSPSLVILEDKP
ncbi:MAG: hypothetical protein GY765_06510 [bacterium]|nr:hypothetical protein [bacterium]